MNSGEYMFVIILKEIQVRFHILADHNSSAPEKAGLDSATLSRPWVHAREMPGSSLLPNPCCFRARGVGTGEQHLGGMLFILTSLLWGRGRESTPVLRCDICGTNPEASLLNEEAVNLHHSREHVASRHSCLP